MKTNKQFVLLVTLIWFTFLNCNGISNKSERIGNEKIPLKSSSYKGLVMAGYQAWFNAEGDGAEMIYVAMFDEIDEGIAIFKCAHKVPVELNVFVPIEPEIPTDYYLWLTGQATRMLRKEIPFQQEIPVK